MANRFGFQSNTTIHAAFWIWKPDPLFDPIAKEVMVNLNDLQYLESNQPANLMPGITGIAISGGTLTVTGNNSFKSGMNAALSGLGNATFLNGLIVHVRTATPAQFTATMPPISAEISRIQILGNVLTVTANNTFTVGMTVTFPNLVNATFLNGQTVTITSVSTDFASPSGFASFTADFNHADYGTAGCGDGNDSGVAVLNTDGYSTADSGAASDTSSRTVWLYYAETNVSTSERAYILKGAPAQAFLNDMEALWAGMGASQSGAGSSGFVSNGLAGQLAYYATTGTMVSGTPEAYYSNGTITLGGPVSGQLILKGSVSGGVTISEQANAGTWTLTLPTNAGSLGQVLQTDGTGITIWAAPPPTGVISISGAGIATGTVTSTGSITVLGSGNTFVAATTLPNVSTAPAGDIISSDGFGNVQDSNVSLASVAILASPAFTGIPTAPTAAPGTSTGQIATTAFVLSQGFITVSSVPVASVFGRVGAVVAATGDYTVAQVTGAAPLASPVFTGIPVAPTAAPLTDNNQIATTAYVDSAVGVETSRAEAAETLLQPLSQKGQPNGYASLDAGGLVPTSQLPVIPLTNTYVVASQAAMLALPDTQGEVAVRTDVNETFILAATPASVLSNWVELLFPPAAVTSVNGFIGVVDLAFTDLSSHPTTLAGYGITDALSNTTVLPSTFGAITHEWLNSYSAITGLFTATQPASTDLSDYTSLAYLASPTFIGTVTIPTAAITTATITTLNGNVNFTGAPTSSTPATVDNSTKIATTAYVQAQGYITSAGAPVQSVFGRTGVVIAVSGDYTVAMVTGAASLVSPTFTGTPLSTTPLTSDNSTRIATTAYVQAQGYLTAASSLVTSVFGRTGAVIAVSGDYTVAQVTGAAPLVSPAFTGIPTAPTASPLTANTQIATTAYADSAVSVERGRAIAAEALLAPLASPTFSGTVTFANNIAVSGTAAFAAGSLVVTAFATTGTWAFTGTMSGAYTMSGTETVSGTLTSSGGTISGSWAGAPTLTGNVAFTGVPTSTTPATADNSTKIATTAYVQAQGYITALTAPVTSVFGRTGAVVATSGDYTVAQVTGAAPLASPTFTGTAAFANITVSGTTSFAAGSIAYAALSGTPTITNAWSALTNATGNLTLANAGFTTTFNQTSAVLWDWENTTTASAITTNASPLHGFSAQYWNGASANDQWTIGSVMTAGTNAISTLTIAHTGTTGAAQIQLPTPLSYGVTDPQIIGPAGATCGISIGGNASFPLLVATIAGSVDIMRGYQGGTNQGSITSQSTSVSFGLYNQLALGTAEIGSAQSPSATYTGGKPLVSLGHGGSTWATTGAGPYIGINVGAEVSLGGNNSVHLNWAPTAGAGTFTAMQIAPTINQTLTASGSYTALKVAVTETALLGTANKLIDCFAGAAGTTEVFSVDNKGNVMQAGHGNVSAANGDTAGVITSGSGTTVSKTYAVNYTSTPIVVVTPTTNAGAFYISASSNSGFTITYATSGAQTFNCMVTGNPN